MTDDEKIKDTIDKIKKAYAHKFWDNHTYVKIPCLGEFCRDGVEIDSAELAFRIEEDDWKDCDFSRFMCDHCHKHGGRGELYTRWEQLTPAIFRQGAFKTRKELLPLDVWEEIKAYGFSMFESQQSLYLYGATGTCKSRMLAMLLYHFVAKQRKTFAVYRGGELRVAFERLSSTAWEGKADDFRTEARKTDVLVFDDFGIDNLTDSMLRQYWEIMDKRFSSGQPTIFASNIPVDGLLSRYGKSLPMLSLIRRIKDYCVQIKSHGTQTQSK